MPTCQRSAPLDRAFRLAAALLALTLALVQSAAAQSNSAALQELGYRLLIHPPQAAAELYYGDDLVWSLPRSARLTVLAFSGPRDMTGNGWPDLMVLTGMGRSARFIEVLELGPEPARSVYENGLREVDANDLMQLPEGRFLGKTLVELGLQPLDPARLSPLPGGGYQLEHSDDGLSRLVIRRDGSIVWVSEHTVLDGLSDPMDMTGDGVENLLVHEAVSRSQRRLHLLALGADGVVALWQVSGNAADIRPLLERLQSEVEAGRSIAESPAALGDRTPNTDPQAQLEALGFDIRWQDDLIELRLDDVVLWREGGFMLQHNLLPAAVPDHLRLVIRYMLSRQSSIETTLELGPHGMRMLWQSSIYHGPPVPGRPQPSEPGDSEAPSVEIPMPMQPLPGYEITLTEARDRLVVRNEGREAWSLEAEVITYHRLWPGTPPALAELRIQSQDATGAVTNHILPLAGDGPGEASSRPFAPLTGDVFPDDEALMQMMEGMWPPRPGGEIPEGILDQLQQLRPTR